MSNYFDYISESAQSEINSTDDVDKMYNEMDAVMCEFDSYVQEGVGVVLAAAGGAALLAGLIALIIKCFGSSSSSSVSKSAKNLKRAIETAKKENLPLPECELPDVESIKNSGEAVINEVDNCEGNFQDVLNNVPIEVFAQRQGIPSPTASVTVGEPYGDTKKPQHGDVKKLAAERHNQYLPIVYSKPKSWEDVEERVDAIIQVSSKIAQKEKSLKKTEKKVRGAEKTGSIKLTQQQQSRLQQSQGKAGTVVSKTFAIFQKGIANISKRISGRS